MYHKIISLLCYYTGLCLGSTNYRTDPLKLLHNRNELPLQYWIPMKIDNFNPLDQRIWEMKFFEDLRFFRPGGPIIFQVGPESKVPGTFYHLCEELAYATGGAMYGNEHRYYGNPHQFDTLLYLSSKQAMADVASLLKTLKMDPRFRSSKVVLVGGSYAGTLAAWMRLQYPDLVDAVHASSAPLLHKVDAYEYMQHLSDVFKAYCYPHDFQGIKQKLEHYDMLIKTGNIFQFASETGVCYSIRTIYDMQSVIEALIATLSEKAQYGNPHNLTNDCHMINNDIRKYGFNRTSEVCLDLSFDRRINSYISSNHQVRLWYYQKCSELGNFQTLSSDAQIFTQNVPIEYYYETCKVMFGPSFDAERIKRGVAVTNRLYGGLNPKFSRVVFVNGDMDPWSRLSALKHLSPEAPARVIRGGSHCQDLNPAYGNQEVINAQEFSITMVRRWIQQ